MIRFILVAATVIIFLILSIPVLVVQWLIGRKDRHLREVQSLAVVQWIFRILLGMAGVSITVKGRENIPADRAVLYVGNHRSYFDILVGYVSVPGLMGFVAKKEMEKIPLLSAWMKNVNCLFLDRQNLKEGLKTILTGIEQVKRGVSVWIFPEGTRNREENPLDLLPFKEGSIKIAEKSGCPVVPVAMTGTAEVFESHFPFIRPSQVTIEFGTPIYTKELEPEFRKFPGAYVESQIKAMLEAELISQGKLSGRA
ncbi:lysophospholipid acyltransferase family protein [Lacrimispora saccharolytica]|uniref:1-acyl-sn-glycerol-3-phosphate acyltransferase n=1 Tax=Lacrimispora saccharolytica (strain ATCC 35040 / DSM 2544 / NRCC 2533 / WM1) TaxID=610130 RepID=D9R3X2_LACSW|nr:lysophospholipid acyltransferase family protein [Lacrimispora saccharolytica]ADL03085.1 1-acyl-sn-glycerol-3-phosphate acyltransferase [[Clostridium] saccharolyticum WM1]QRV18735.1 1-acyl-sn-glycerol-3-phosphate acyltransferase [Lacrimispora saccharolytica]